MRDTISTPIIRYDGPPELRKSLEMEGRKFLGYVKGVLGGGLPYQKYVGRYNDGTTIEVQSISHVGELDIIKITVPVGHEAIEVKKERKKRILTKVGVVELPVPMLVMEDFEDVQVFMACKALMEPMKYPDTGVDDKNTYVPYAASMGDIDILSLKPIADGNCMIQGRVNWEVLTILDSGDKVGIAEGVPGLYNHEIASAVVKGEDNYTDYKTWGVIYASSAVPIPSVESTAVDVAVDVKMAFSDPDKGFREYFLETVIIPEYQTLADLKGFGSVRIFDYYGTPYFVTSYVGIFGEYIG